LRVEQKPQKTRVWIVHKLSGEVVSERDPQGRPSLVDRLKRSGLGLHLMPIGRLDMTAEGLILLTTDGAYARELELPRNHVHHSYRVCVHGNLTPHKLKAVRRSGITIKNVRYNGMQVQLEDTGR
jgi:23S rRNA pseudouridine2605 synthase